MPQPLRRRPRLRTYRRYSRERVVFPVGSAVIETLETKSLRQRYVSENSSLNVQLRQRFRQSLRSIYLKKERRLVFFLDERYPRSPFKEKIGKENTRNRRDNFDAIRFYTRINVIPTFLVVSDIAIPFISFFRKYHTG